MREGVGFKDNARSAWAMDIIDEGDTEEDEGLTGEGDLDGDEGEAELEEVELARPPKNKILYDA